MDKVYIIVLVALAIQVCQAYDCCGAYTDYLGTYHESELCADYCCVKLSLTNFKECCNDPTLQVPATDRDNENCLNLWIREHIWVPIVGGIVGLILIIGICTCCCCCGCCACCRKSPQPVVIHTTAMPASTTIAMSRQTVVNRNPAHYGYDQ